MNKLNNSSPYNTDEDSSNHGHNRASSSGLGELQTGMAEGKVSPKSGRRCH
jgi:hypothetical protein